MTLAVFLAVLASAALHAAWNAAVKASPDRTGAMAALTFGSALLCVPALPFAAAPPAEAIAWLVLGVAGSVATQLALTRAYATGAFGVAYPLTRGLSPVLVALAAFAALGERPAPAGLAGIAAIALGVGLLALEAWRGMHRRDAAETLALGLLAALFAAIYAVANALGTRASGSAIGFGLWSSVAAGLVWLGLVPGGRRAMGVTLVRHWRIALLGGIAANASFLLLLWAFLAAPVALVAALRETAVLFGLLVAAIWLKEPLTALRIVAGLALVAGLVLLKAG